MRNLLGVIRCDLEAHGFRASIVHFIIALFSSPGFFVITNHRICVKLREATIFGRFLSRILWRFGVLFSGCYISPKALIGKGLHMPHPVGIVIGDAAVLGEFVTLYQGVTIGTKGKNDAYPSIGNGVTIFANSVVVSGIKVGDNCTIGALSYVGSNIPCNTTAYGAPARPVN